MPTKNRMTPGFWEPYQGASLTEEEWRFGAAMNAYMRHTGKKYWDLDCCDVLAVAKALGYTKVVDVKPQDVIFMGG